MKFLKLIPAAAIVLTAFTTFEAKSENRVCLQNKGAFSSSLSVRSKDNGAKYEIFGMFTNPRTNCADLDNLITDEPGPGNLSIKVGSQYKVIGHADLGKTVDCSGWIKRENGDGSKTWVISGTTLDVSCREK